MAAISKTLATALQHHQAGRRQAAAQVCRSILDVDPDQPDACHLLGVLSHEMGQHQTAIEYLQRAIRSRGNVGIFHNNLGEAYRAARRIPEAIACYRQALTLQPNLAQAHNNLGNAFQDQRELDAAIACYRRALELKPDYVEAHFNLGITFRELENLDEAAACLRRALAFSPEFAQAYSNLGYILREQGDLPGALNCCRRAVQINPELAEAHNSLGLALRAQGELDAALNGYRRAVQIQPDFVEAHANLADALIELGQLPQAEAAFRRALELQPQFVPALTSLAMLKRGHLPESDLAELEKQLAHGQLSARLRAGLSFALAHVLDGRGDYSRAAECLRQANGLRLKLARKRYDPTAYEQFAAGLMRTFDAGFFTRLSGMGLDTRQPVFVFGLPRSGTTLIEQILASHPQVHGGGELQLARGSYKALRGVDQKGGVPLSGAATLDRAGLQCLAEQHLDRLRAIGSAGVLRIVDKMPENYLYLGLLAVMFPRATFLHCRRDLRDVAVSCWMSDFKTVPWANAPEHIAARIRQYQRLMAHWRNVLPVTIHDVSYEETVTDLEGVARRLVACCGLDWDPACVEFHRTVRPIRTVSASQVRQPAHRDSVGRWRRYAFEMAEMLAQFPPDSA